MVGREAIMILRIIVTTRITNLGFSSLLADIIVRMNHNLVDTMQNI